MRVLSIFPPYSNTEAPTPKCISPKTFKWFPLKMGKIHKNRAKLHNQIWYHTHNVVNVIRQINWQGAGVVFPSTSTCFATWRIWKQRGSQRKETVVVFDDLSWVCFIWAGHGPQINSFVVLRSLGLLELHVRAHGEFSDQTTPRRRIKYPEQFPETAGFWPWKERMSCVPPWVCVWRGSWRTDWNQEFTKQVEE